MGTPRGEALLAVLGLGPILGEEKASLTVEKREAIQRLPKRIHHLARDYLTETEWRKPSSPGPVEWKPWVALMAIPPDSARVKEAAQRLGDDAGAYVQQAMEAWAYLSAQFPRTMRRGLIGAVPEPPPQVYLYRFRRSYTVCDDPLSLLEQALCGFVNSDEVAALSKVFPALYADIQRAFIEEAKLHKQRHPKWDLPRRRRETLATLLQIPRKPGYVAALQARFAQPEPQEQRSGTLNPGAPGKFELSQTQRAELPNR